MGFSVLSFEPGRSRVLDGRGGAESGRDEMCRVLAARRAFLARAASAPGGRAAALRRAPTSSRLRPVSIVRINEFSAAEGKAGALRDFLSAVIDVVSAAPGCEGCELLADPENAARLVIVETWDSVASHQAAATRIPKEKLAEVRPLLGEPPKGRYYERLR
jgi:heme oxygenase (mycobilin-producing)